MPLTKLVCPMCEAQLRPPTPVPAGKKIKCPKCGATFAAQGDEEDVRVTGAPAPAKKSPGKPAAPKQKKHYEDDDDDGPATYGVVREPEEPAPEVHHDEEENLDDEEETEGKGRKPKITYTPDLSVKDPRGPAQRAVIPPGNGLLIAGVASVLVSVGMIMWAIFPFVFPLNTEGEWVDVVTVLGSTAKDKEKSGGGKGSNNPQAKLRSEWTAAELALIEDAERELIIWRSIYVGSALFSILFNAFVCVGAVKMVNLESYGWSMTAAIMGILGGLQPLGLIFGVWSLMTLKDEKVKAGFKYIGV